MELFLYIIIFITGTFFGSFFTLAVYRIPKKEDILIKHSYCPNCNHKLGFFDLFPVLSYIFLNGKCRYCKNKIRPRYLILELLTGLSFLILAIATKANILNSDSIINLIFLLMYISILFIIIGIDKENLKIEKSVLGVGFIIEIIYIIYQYALYNFSASAYQYVMYLIGFIITILLLKIFIKDIQKREYFIQIMCLSLYMIVFCGIKAYTITLISALIILALRKIISKKTWIKEPVGFYLSICNIIIIAIYNVIVNYII